MTPLALALLGMCNTPVSAQTATDPGAPASSRTLPTVHVTGQADATTEDSGSYAAHSATVAGKTPQSLKEIPASVSVLTRQRIDDQNMTTIQDALQYVTGVESVNYGDGTAYFKARGNTLGVEFDGVSIGSGLQYLQQFDLAMYDRVEVLRGPSGVMDGASDPGGTVNLVRKRPQDSFHLVTETQLGSFGSARQMVDVTGPLNKDGTLRGRAVLLGSDGLQSVHGVRAKETMAYGALDYDIAPRTTLSLSAGYQINPISGLDYGVSGILVDDSQLGGALPSSYSRNFSPSWNRSYTSLQEANLDLTHRFENNWTLRTTVFYRHELAKADYAYSGPGVTAGGLSYYGAQRQRNTYNWFGMDSNLSGPFQLFGQTDTLTLGANYARLSYTQLSGFVALNGPFADGMYSVFDPNAVPDVDVPFTYGARNSIEQYGVYTQARIHLADPLTLVLGGREAFLQEQSQSILPTPSSWTTQVQINHRFLTSIGLVYNIAPWLTAYANDAKFLTAQTQTTYAGAGLPPRSGEQYEAGLKSSFFDGRLTATAAAFRINDEHRAIADPDHPYASIVGGKALDQGLELELAGQPLPNWNLYAGYTLLNVDYQNDVPDLTDGTDPRHLFKLWTNYRFSQGRLDGFSVGGGVLAQSAITRGVEQEGYAIYDAQVGYRFNPHLEMSLQLNNMFDRQYYIRPPGTFYSVFGDRRNAMLTARLTF